MLFKIKTVTALDIPSLKRRVIMFIHFREQLNTQQIDEMFDSIKKWIAKIGVDRRKREDGYKRMADKIIGFDANRVIDTQEEHEIKNLVYLLKADGEGLLERKKKLYKEHKINPWRAYKDMKFPGAITPEAQAKADFLIEEAKKENPEDFTANG